MAGPIWHLFSSRCRMMLWLVEMGVLFSVDILDFSKGERD